jgi:hypothetical protein
MIDPLKIYCDSLTMYNPKSATIWVDGIKMDVHGDRVIPQTNLERKRK